MRTAIGELGVGKSFVHLADSPAVNNPILDKNELEKLYTSSLEEQDSTSISPSEPEATITPLAFLDPVVTKRNESNTAPLAHGSDPVNTAFNS
jgi:hypothetical protein